MVQSLFCFAFQNQSLVFISFLVFEVCVGIFWPSMGTMRGKYVPEQGKLSWKQGSQNSLPQCFTCHITLNYFETFNRKDITVVF